MVEAVQTDTVSHLTSDAEFSHQDCLRPIIIRLLQGSQEFLSGRAAAAFCHGQDIFIPGNPAQLLQPIQSAGGNGFRRGKE